MKSGNKRVGGKTGAIIALCVLLVVTIVLGVIGVTGLSLPPRGLYKVLSWLPTTNSENWPASLPLGLDLRGGMYVEYSGKAPEGSEANFDDLVEGTISIIRARLGDKGYNEVSVQRIGVDGIRVEIPNVQDDTVLDLIGQTAEMKFLDPNGEVIMKGDQVKTATYAYQDGKHVIAFELTDEGRNLFADATSKNVGQNIKITLDDEVLVNATVQTAITDGRGIISGSYTQEQALTTAAQIQSGALPLELTQQKVDKVSATLGQDALSTSVKAALIGIYHDASEIITGDMPTPVKYYNPDIREAYKEVERIAEAKLLNRLPEDLRPAYEEIFRAGSDGEEKYMRRLVKAADKISAYLKCIEEEQAGNTEFRTAKKTIWKAVLAMQEELPEVRDFCEEFLPSYGKTLDELA